MVNVFFDFMTFLSLPHLFFFSEGSNLTPAHHYSDFRFKTYAPIAFRYFRELFGIRPDDYLVSTDSKQTLLMLFCTLPVQFFQNYSVPWILPVPPLKDKVSPN